MTGLGVNLRRGLPRFQRVFYDKAMTFGEFSKYLARLERTPSRNEMTAILAELLKALKPAEARQAIYLSLGQLAPAYAGLELNIAEKLMFKILARAYGAAEAEVIRLFKQKGDLGFVAELLAGAKKPAQTLVVTQVYQALSAIAQTSGAGSVAGKVQAFSQLLQSVDGLSARFIVRIPLAKLRLGFSDVTILDALSYVAAGDKSRRPVIERAFNVSADIGQVVAVFKAQGVAGLKKIAATPGVPIRMSAAERLPNAQSIIDKLGRAISEPKYDGFRIQVHVFEKQVKIFSRNLENTTAMFPDIAAAAQKLPVKSIIFEGEAISYNPDTDEFRPFQETMQRKRKHDIGLFAEQMPLQIFAFDILYINGEEVLNKPFRERRQILEKVFPPAASDEAIVATRSDTVDNASALEKLFDEYVAEGLEGVIVKKMDAPYQAGARGFHWIKFKRAMRGELADTIDAVVMGYYRGRGKRSGFGIGAFLAGVYDPKAERFKSVAKIGTGLTDEEWREMRRRADGLKRAVPLKNYVVVKNLAPDVWVKPGLVVEIQADEITRSPIHTAAQDKEGVGLALRFPRLVKFRADKTPEQATSEKELVALFKMQAARR